MKYSFKLPVIVSVLLFTLNTYGKVYPATMAEYYCDGLGMSFEACQNISLDQALCLNRFTPQECRELSGSELCRKTPRTKAECKSFNFTEGFCLFSGFAESDCKGVSASTLACKLRGKKSFDDCQDLNEAEAMCLSQGRATSDCVGIKTGEVLCWAVRKDQAFCKGIAVDDIPCVKNGFSKEHIAQGCEEVRN